MLALDLAIDRGEVEAQLAQMLGFEFTGFEFDHHIAAQLEVVEEQIHLEFVTAHVQEHLPAHEGKAGAKFQQECGDMIDQSNFDLTLLRLVGEVQEVEPVRVFKRLASEIGFWLGQRGIEVGHGLATTLQLVGLDLQHQYIARPVVFDRL